MVIQLKVCDPKGLEKIIDLCDNIEQMKNITVEQLKKKIEKQLTIGQDFRMVYGTVKLEESSLLMYYGIKHLSTIHTLLILEGGLN